MQSPSGPGPGERWSETDNTAAKILLSTPGKFAELVKAVALGYPFQRIEIESRHRQLAELVGLIEHVEAPACTPLQFQTHLGTASRLAPVGFFGTDGCY